MEPKYKSTSDKFTPLGKSSLNKKFLFGKTVVENAAGFNLSSQRECEDEVCELSEQGTEVIKIGDVAEISKE